MTDYRPLFDAHRDAYTASVFQLATAQAITVFRVCDDEGEARDWIWNKDSFAFEGQEGDASHARDYLDAMINQGMHVAVIVADGKSGPEMWLTAWEAPQSAPVWPRKQKGRKALSFKPLSIQMPQRCGRR